MSNMVKIAEHCEHEQCQEYWLDSICEAVKEICCDDNVCEHDAVEFPCVQK